jgi:hypothetical protein
MPTYKITGPDGTVYRITGEGTAEEALAQIQAQAGATKPQQPAAASAPPAPAAAKPTPATHETSAAERLAADRFIRFAVGAAEPVQGAVQRLSEAGVKSDWPLLQLLGMAAAKSRKPMDESFLEIKEMAKRGGQSGVDLAGIAGNVASPVSLAFGGVQAPASLLGKTALGAAAGGTGGFLAPAKDMEEALGKAGFGAFVSGALPPLLVGGGKAIEAVANTGRHFSDLFTKQGASNIVNRYIRGPGVVGEEKLPALLAKLRGAEDMIDNGRPTVAEALVGAPEGSPIAALQKAVAQRSGGISSRFGERAAQQETAVKAAEATRRAESAVNYAKAFDVAKNPVKQDAALLEIAKNPYFRDALPEAKKLAEAKGIDPDVNLTQFLHDVKLGLDRKLMSEGESALSAAQYKEIQSVKSRLVDWLRARNSDYETGRKAHSQASRFIDGYKLRQQDALSPPQKTNLFGTKDVAGQTAPKLPTMFSNPMTIARWVMRGVASGADKRIDDHMADMLLDPKVFAKEMERLPPQTIVDLDKWLRAANAASAGAAATQ